MRIRYFLAILIITAAVACFITMRLLKPGKKLYLKTDIDSVQFSSPFNLKQRFHLRHQSYITDRYPYVGEGHPVCGDTLLFLFIEPLTSKKDSVAYQHQADSLAFDIIEKVYCEYNSDSSCFKVPYNPPFTVTIASSKNSEIEAVFRVTYDALASIVFPKVYVEQEAKPGKKQYIQKNYDKAQIPVVDGGIPAFNKRHTAYIGERYPYNSITRFSDTLQFYSIERKPTFKKDSVTYRHEADALAADIIEKVYKEYNSDSTAYKIPYAPTFCIGIGSENGSAIDTMFEFFYNPLEMLVFPKVPVKR